MMTSWLRSVGLVAAIGAGGACSSSGSGGGVVDGGPGGAGGVGATGGAGATGGGGTGGQSDSGVCKIDGQICAAFGECCTGTCTQGRCGGVACVADGGSCTVFGDCCNGSCVQGTCGGGADAGPGYPPGPYGVNVGDIIENTSFDGFGGGQTNQLKTISLGDFYNPTDAAQKPRLLVLAMKAMWASPAVVQAEKLNYVFWNGSNRVEFLSVFSDGQSSGIAATKDELKFWVTAFSVAHPVALDPNFSKLSALFAVGGAAVPYNVYIDTRTMKIVEQQAGGQEFDTTNSVLNGLLGS